MGRLQRTAAEEGERIISSHLKPPYAQVLSEARKLAPGLKGARTEAEVLAKDAREPWLKLQVLAQTYQSLHLARRTVVTIMGAESSDTLNKFTEFEDMDVLRPNLRLAAPWPEEGWAKLAWIATTSCKPWLPTPSEQEARWEAWWKECGGEERSRLHNQVHAMGGC